MKIGELAKKSGVAPSAIRFYEEQGLLAPISRTAAGYREYASNAPDRLELIQGAKKLGFSLDDIRGMLEENGKCSIEKTRRQTAILLKEVEAQQEALARRHAALLYLREALTTRETDINLACRERFNLN
ncbi:MerR family transcriptional regulator [Duganella callida]|uniref:MerR family transcriptional regulator n=1 Tax=Duganella callida TaxID=2561932 RepID=A0A4Y9SEZ8_9BURK|nr:MerR family transcriptional regulator [Duganella callida]TFW21680.1 MerR family transcriptional regulator [Duganella callida]